MGILTADNIQAMRPDVDTGVAWEYIADVEAQAFHVAPCLRSISVGHADYDFVVSILRQAVLRWIDSGEGVQTTLSQSADVFSQSVTSTPMANSVAKFGGRLFASELRQLRDVCRTGTARRRVFTVSPR